MKVDLLEPTDPRWRRFLDEAPHDFHHRPEFVVHSARTTEPGAPLAILVEDSEVAMLLPIIRRALPEGDVDATSPYGYPGPIFRGQPNTAFVGRACTHLSEFLRAERYVSLFVRMHPLLDPDPAGLTTGTVVNHGETVVIDLSRTEEEQWRQHQSGHRSEINQALRAGHDVVLDDDWTHADDFLRLYRQTMTRLGASRYYFFDEAYFDGFRKALGPGGSRLALVRVRQQVAAAAIITSTCGIVQYHLSGSDEAFARERPTKLLLHQVRRWASAAGHRWFHLGGGLGAAADSLFRFKAGFSKLRRTFRTWRVAVNPSRFVELVRARDPFASTTDFAGFFPPYRRP